MYIQSAEELRKLYGFPKGRAKDKQLGELEQHSINFIKHSPFMTVSTHNTNGLTDCSPRGGSIGFVKILNDNCILIPDANGNNRLDSLVNIIETGHIGCLFLIPGVDETLRVNGSARLSTKKEHLLLFSGKEKPPKACIEVTIKEVFLHCAKAFMRSELWSPQIQIDRSTLPTMGAMINSQLGVTQEPESQEEMIKRYKNAL